MAPRRVLPWPLLLPCGLIILFALVPIILAAVGIKLTPWPGMLMLSILLLVIALVPIVFMAVGIKLTRTRTLIGVVCISIGTAVILAFGFHLVVGGLAVGGLMLVGAVPRVYKDYARLHERDANKGPTA